ncbi:MAG: nickel pincer cofactor biosynthesis protein LarC [Kiritimatiellae bacterium]|nr:nickel pincer cofactor biosynthesis protein LarC [Kiritimatiellia bacterium]
MKALYFDARCGAAGDMVTGALLGLVPDMDASLARLNAMGLDGVSFSAEKTSRGGLAGTHVAVSVHGEVEGRGHHHGHDLHHHDGEGRHHHGQHHHATPDEIEHAIDSLKVSDAVKGHAKAIYGLVAKAESEAHGVPASEVHFHEVGALDAIADVAAASLLVEELAPDRIFASVPEVGGGFVKCAHGVLPVPAPATVGILKGVPFTSGAEECELLTPTGAAILVHFAESFGAMPEFAVEKTGIGCGTRELEGRPNVLRAFMGTTGSGGGKGGPNGKISELVCDIDDMTGEDIAFACDRLRAAGAVDVSLSPLFMKKGRPGNRLTVLARPEDADRLAAEMLRETSTFGVRRSDCVRYELDRRIERGPDGIRVKTGSGYGAAKSKPEFADRKAMRPFSAPCVRAGVMV